VHTSSICEELAVEGSLAGDARKVYQAIAFDPLTSAVLGIQEIKEMTAKMFRQNRDYLPRFSNFDLG